MGLTTVQVVEKVLYNVALAGAAIYLLVQVRKPDRWAGRLFTWIMNMSHSSVTDWGLRHVQVAQDFTILDVGCGGGRTIQKLAAMASEGKVYGVDYAAGSVAASRSKNAELIRAGRVEIKEGTVSELPFADASFDLVTAVETQYYWPDLEKDMREILRVLKPGGRLVVILESYKKGAGNAVVGPVMKALKASNLSVEEQRELFLRAGYVEVDVFEERGKGWFCGVGRKGLPA